MGARIRNQTGFAPVAFMVIAAAAMLSVQALLGDGARARVWDYPQALPAYAFPIDVDVVAYGIRPRAEASLPDATTVHPLIADVWPAPRPFRPVICMGVENQGDTCSVGNTDKASGVAFIVGLEQI